MKRSKFSLSHYKLLTADMGYLIPLTWYETLPGDTMQQATSALIRVSPLLSPVMHPVVVRINHFYVPLRLIWDDWEDFITGGEDGTFTATPPYTTAGTVEGTLKDYLGVFPGTTGINISMLPARAYSLIWNEYYRDQDLQTALTISKASGADTTTNQTLQNVCWEKDYFTTSRPWEQKGDDINIPLGNSAPVTGIGPTGTPAYTGTTDFKEAGGTTYTTDDVTNTGLSALYYREDPNNSGYPGIYADLSSATGIPISDVRLSFALQRYQEARAQYGSRYVEYLRYLGVRSSDARLQNPEYLGGGRQVISFSEVLSTDGSNTGDLKGHGIAAMRTNRFRRFFEEHGIVMSLMSVIPKSIYTQGLNRKFSRQTKEDYFQRELQTIGEQEVFNKEVYTPHTTPEGVFGYQARYDEYRSHPSGISGEFHSTNDHWHYGRIFSADPALNSTFVSSTPTKRVNASAGTDCLYIMANHSIQSRRPIMPIAKNKTY